MHVHCTPNGIRITPYARLTGRLKPGSPEVQRTLYWNLLAAQHPVRVRVVSPVADLSRVDEAAVVNNGQTTIFNKASGLPVDAVQSLFQDDDGRIWASTVHGLAYFKDGSFVAVNCAAIVLVLVWAVHRFRTGQLRHEFNMTLEARVGERTRIAGNLHDTLLQGAHASQIRMEI